MGLDDLWRFQLALALVAFVMTLLVSGSVTLLSYGAWRWALSMLASGRSVARARALSLIALSLAGLPLAYTLGLMASSARSLAAAGLVFVLILALIALVHAAFRDESIRHLSGDRQLAETVAELDEWERASWLRGTGRLALPSLTGATRRRTLQRAAMAAFVWLIPLILLPILRS